MQGTAEHYYSFLPALQELLILQTTLLQINLIYSRFSVVSLVRLVEEEWP